MTCGVSAMLGTAAGDTKLPASMWVQPARCSRRISSALSSADSAPDGSFCKPSRGPTSTTRTSGGASTRVGLSRGPSFHGAAAAAADDENDDVAIFLLGAEDEKLEAEEASAAAARRQAAHECFAM